MDKNIPKWLALGLLLGLILLVSACNRSLNTTGEEQATLIDPAPLQSQTETPLPVDTDESPSDATEILQPLVSLPSF